MLSAARRAVTPLFFVVVPLAISAQPAPARGAHESGKSDNHAAASALVPLPPQAPDVPWPGENWPEGPLPTGVAADQLERAFAVVGARDARLGETRAVVIVQRGRLVAERYMAGFGPETPLLSWSMAKSVTQALLGIAVRRGLVAIDDPMGNPRWPAGDARSAITWRAWINMVDGQKYDEIGAPDPTHNDAARMLFGEGRLDVAGYAATLPLAATPGVRWNYNSAGINLIADALGRVFAPNADPATRRARVAAVMKEELFGPLGMTSAQPEFDKTGTFVGSALVYATARDWARFGLLYLRDGLWKERRILPEGWVDFARSKTTADNCDVYGAGWWITPPTGAGKPYHAPNPFLSSNSPRRTRTRSFEGTTTTSCPSCPWAMKVSRGPVLMSAFGEWVDRVVALFPDTER
ncbi:MAG TPA: serine hydrolase [Polyangiaceae bacterium]|nr:serine hydrolase [Polyangiaceae bacterium]